MKQMQTKHSRARGAAFVFEASAFALVAVMASGSAVVAKRFSAGPALVAIDEPATNRSILSMERPTVSAERDDSSAGPIAPSPSPELVAEVVEPALADMEIVTPPEGFERYFDGRPIRAVKTIWMTVTAYSPDAQSCPGTDDGYTATNHSVWTNAMQIVAADPTLLPYGSLLTVPGYANGEVVPVLDCGSAIKGRRLDVLYATHEIARQWGRKRLPVTIWEYADGGSRRENFRRK